MYRIIAFPLHAIRRYDKPCLWASTHRIKHTELYVHNTYMSIYTPSVVTRTYSCRPIASARLRHTWAVQMEWTRDIPRANKIYFPCQEISFPIRSLRARSRFLCRGTLTYAWDSREGSERGKRSVYTTRAGPAARPHRAGPLHSRPSITDSAPRLCEKR